jgi:hypothetical protein
LAAPSRRQKQFVPLQKRERHTHLARERGENDKIMKSLKRDIADRAKF